ncbi:MAG TPA: sigma-70 family RNA polymerase sigma factor [Mycobacteriales bacterium]|nr:sigma-70 family RNA polymerase sigma factor [Mycobacteriales bacterium]
MSSGVAAAAGTGPDVTALWTAAVAGDRDAFATVTGRHRYELAVHCYRMLGSYEDAEDVVQETLLRAWRKRATYRGRSTIRAWLYGIATNACLDQLGRRTRRLLPQTLTPPADPRTAPLPASEIGWLEPYPDVLLDRADDPDAGPEEVAVARETIELAFLVAIQHLPPRQRAVLILRDVLGWSAREAAEVVGTTVVAANSALQRARSTLKQHLPERRVEWGRSRTPDEIERQLLDRYMDAWERTDVEALVALLAHDARLSMPPLPSWYEGPAAIRDFLAQYPMAPTAARHLHVPTRANRQPAFAIFLQDAPGEPMRPLGITVLRVENGLITEIDAFLDPALVERFAVPAPA